MTIMTVMESIASCLCAQIKDSGSPETCFCGVVPGSTAIQEYAGDCDERNGMAWVRLALSYPATGVGIAAEGPVCAGTGFDLEVGVVRRVPLQEEALDEAQSLQLTRFQMDDMASAQRAVECCGLSSKDYSLGAYTPLGPQGDLVGGFWTVYVML